jgi:hypothetical protein
MVKQMGRLTRDQEDPVLFFPGLPSAAAGRETNAFRGRFSRPIFFTNRTSVLLI